ncbi:MAG: DUF6364 family protein [Spirochaetaceae bacterium]|jgi:predicted solute-binding protein|nr:DUF6364 family protein [Spirochaetaceae bacterium]
MNITLSADKALIENSRHYAKKHHTTLNNLVREYLKRITNETEGKSIAEEFNKLARDFGGESSTDFKFNRDDIYNRGQ